MSQSHPAPSRTNDVVRLQLSSDQTKQLAPLAIEASREHKNILFLASIVPFWAPQKGESLWELQTVKVPAMVGYKIAKLIREALHES